MSEHPSISPITAVETSALLPCPFCNGTMQEITDEDGHYFVHPGRKGMDRADCWLSDAWVSDEPTGEGSIGEWNARPHADETPTKEEFATWARAWHDTCETMTTILGLPGNGSPQELLAQVQSYVGQPAKATETDFDEYPYDDERFNKGVEHVVDLLAKTIGATNWYAGDGSEDYDEDLAQTLLNILAAKGLYDKDTGEFRGGAQKPRWWLEPTLVAQRVGALEKAHNESTDHKTRDALRAAIRALDPDSADTTQSALPSTASTGDAAQPKWRHLKRGSIVTEIARGFAQVAHHPIEEMTCVVIYRHDDDGRYWVRNAVEFDDGRFEAYPDRGIANCQNCGDPITDALHASGFCGMCREMGAT